MKKRIAVIDREKCHPQECGNYLCQKLCPVNRAGSDCVTPGDDTKARIDEMLCTGCGICPTRCPYGAITIINLPDTLTKSPIHRYGENLFELYSLPTPIPNQVTGILGKNGIGKSTALKIMSNLVVPNLGNYEEEPNFQDVINYFKGSETQKFIEKIQKNKIILSYKPQQVDLIPKQFSGTVRDLLTKVNPQKVTKVAEKLQLTSFLDQDIKTISGGELQRTAIAASVMKDANVFMFDEPTSYLDIKQRINMAHFIRSLANDDTSVLTIEHDLIILDFMTDNLNIMYGHESTFGIVSGLKSVREGINAFLSGFLKEENVRFRSHPIKFEDSQEQIISGEDTLISWSDVHAQMGTFQLRANAGEIKQKDIIGVLGENGIGKTSFVKLLAGIIKPQSGEIHGEVKVAYKAQYLDSDSDQLVVEFLSLAITEYNRQLIQPLDLEPLFGLKLSELSGGQLQRVAIAHCLSQDAKIFLLDEPSAYLDVEQRLSISKIIRTVAADRNVSIVIVDHDLMFIDYISNKLIVFDGRPAIDGVLNGPFAKEEGMNRFLKNLSITLRRDIHSHRPRINKPHSVKDREQKSANQYYYAK